MLEELRIQDFAIIDRLELTFGAGLNVITGETGAGKSIIIDAVGLLLGAKADAAFVRAGAKKAVVEGVFGIPPEVKTRVMPLLGENDLIDPEAGDFVTITREIRESGRSTARINGVTANLDALQAISELLVDVHGQSEHLSLFKPGVHIDLLDRYGGLMNVRDQVAGVVSELNAVRGEIRRLQEDEAALQRRADLLRHEIEEIEAVELVVGEDDDLLAERSRLTNSEQLAKLTQDSLLLLQGDETGDLTGAVDALSQLSVLLSRLAKIDSDMTEAHELSESLSAQAAEIASLLVEYTEDIEYQPGRLDEVEERLEAINTLKRRYGATIEAVLAHAERAQNELDGIENSEERLEELRAEEDDLLRRIGEMASKISRVRQIAGKGLSQNIIKELADLRMARAQFEVAVTQTDDPKGCYVGDRRLAFGNTGIDNVEFLLSANPGEPLRPLAKVASGGEAARIMLALKRVLTRADQTPTLIFDEIDQGIGGRIGAVVGEKLWSLTDRHQVLVVTHLAQLAGYADSHYRVTKMIDQQQTRTSVIPLGDEDERIAELAAMLGTEGDTGKQSARELMIQAQAYKAQQAAQPTPPPPQQQELF